MSIQTESVGSIPRTKKLLDGLLANPKISEDELNVLYDEAVQDTLLNMDATGSPILTDGEQTKSSFATYPLDGLENVAPEGVVIPFEDGHTRQLPILTKGPFRYANYAGSYIPRAKKFTNKPLKQAVISASAMSLLYPADGIPGYTQEQFINDLINEAVADIRSCFDNGATRVQIDFTEGRLAIKLDPSKGLLQQFIDLNNQVMSHFSAEERKNIGFHTCPGGDHDSTHSADVDYGELIPMLLTLNADNFYMQMASEADPEKALKIIGENIKPNQRIFIGVIDVINEEIESAETVKNRVLTAAKHIPLEQLGTTDDCGFSPFCDDVATNRSTAFSKITARVNGTQLAFEALKNG
jgi:5-methyltetrahydropteroyltriglutamate--homocysteine methyltransferase